MWEFDPDFDDGEGAQFDLLGSEWGKYKEGAE